MKSAKGKQAAPAKLVRQEEKLDQKSGDKNKSAKEKMLEKRLGKADPSMKKKK